MKSNEHPNHAGDVVVFNENSLRKVGFDFFHEVFLHVEKITISFRAIVICVYSVDFRGKRSRYSLCCCHNLFILLVIESRLLFAVKYVTKDFVKPV